MNLIWTGVETEITKENSDLAVSACWRAARGEGTEAFGTCWALVEKGLARSFARIGFDNSSSLVRCWRPRFWIERIMKGPRRQPVHAWPGPGRETGLTRSHEARRSRNSGYACASSRSCRRQGAHVHPPYVRVLYVRGEEAQEPQPRRPRDNCARPRAQNTVLNMIRRISFHLLNLSPTPHLSFSPLSFILTFFLNNMQRSEYIIL